MPMKFPMDLRLHVARQDMALYSDVVFNAFDAGEPLNGFRRRFALVPPIHRTAQGDASAFNADLNPVPGYRTIPFQRIQRGGGDVRIGPLPFRREFDSEFIGNAFDARDALHGPLSGMFFK